MGACTDSEVRDGWMYGCINTPQQQRELLLDSALADPEISKCKARVLTCL